MDWATPIPGNTTVYGGPIRTGSEAAIRELRRHKEDLFEQLLLFESVNFSVNGPNTIVPLLYRAMGEKALEAFLEQDALSFTIWTPQPMMAHDGGKVASTFVGRIGDGNGSELDIERIVDTGLSIQYVGMPDWYKRVIRQKVCARHQLLDEKLPETAWKVAELALIGGELESMGLASRETILGSTTKDGSLFTEAAESILSYRFVLENGMASHNDPGLFKIFGVGAQNLRASTSLAARYTVISDYEKFPNLRTLYGKIDKPFQIASTFRSTHTAKRFREWLSESIDTSSDINIIRDYVDACGNRKGMFESAPAKFLKLTGMVAIGHVILPGAHLLGEAAGAILSGVPAEALGAISETASEVGLGVIDSFVIDNLKIGWTPRAYFVRLRRIQRRGAPNVGR
jgi:hypothetical protein